MGRKNLKILTTLLCLLLAACIKDKPQTHKAPLVANGNVYIVCEGNFGTGDATLYSYNTATDSVFGDIYKAANNQQVGDVLQSIKRIGDSLYLCVNNSDKIVVIDASRHKLAGTISIPKPRYIVPVSRYRAYVSTLYSHKVYIINPQTLQVIGTTELPYKNPEGMCLQSSNIFVCPWDTTCDKVYKTDAATGQVVQEIRIGGYAPHSVLVDKDQMLWVMSGNVPKGRAAVLTRIDPSTGNTLQTYTFPSGTDPIKPVFNITRDTLYFIQVKYDGSANNNGIYRMAIQAPALPSEPFIQAAQFQYFWALGIDPATGHIYTADPKGFIQKGSVTIYNTSGTLLKTFAVGLGPGQFYFGN